MPRQKPTTIPYKPHKESLDYLFASLLGFFFFMCISVFVYYRRGYFDLYIANKALAGSATILLGLVLLIGTGSRLFSFPDKFIQYRKEIGIFAFLLSVLHVIISLFFLPNKFSFVELLSYANKPGMYGLAALGVMTVILMSSHQKSMAALGMKVWWKIQYWGLRITFALITLHVFVMKWPGWIRWFEVGGSSELVHPEWPGAGILVGLFMIAVILIRLSELGGSKFAKAAWYVVFSLLAASYAATFWWGAQTH